MSHKIELQSYLQSEEDTNESARRKGRQSLLGVTLLVNTADIGGYLNMPIIGRVECLFCGTENNIQYFQVMQS